MKKLSILIGLIGVLLGLQYCSQKTQQESGESLVKALILNTNTEFNNQIDSIISDIANNKDIEHRTLKFDQLRNTFKKMEWAVAYFTPQSNRFINGPNLDEIEYAENSVIEAEGLQTLEEYFYPQYDKSNDVEIIRYLRKLKNKSDGVNVYFTANEISKPQIADAIRNEIFRITTLGITGFDTPISGNGIKEVVYSLKGLDDVFEILKQSSKNKASIESVQNQIKKITEIVTVKNNRNDFDYLTFITEDLNKLSDEIHNYIEKENINALNVNNPLNNTAKNIFSKNAWNNDFFTPSERHRSNPEKVKLGALLFKDNILSNDGSMSCQTCHKPELAFTDGLKKSLGRNNKLLKRNSPSLNYSNFQHGQFWDMRREDLENQSSDVINNEDEIHGNFTDIILKLEKNKEYKDSFKKAFRTDVVQTWQIQNVLASYIRSLATFDSNFDEYMRGEKNALNNTEKAGFNLFIGKGKCATCHFIPLFNGTLPPEYSKTESEILGTPYDNKFSKIDLDLGRGEFSILDQTKYAFKTPTLRNINLTAPYMHNGVFKTLEEVMEFYNEGGGNGYGFKLDYQTLPNEKLNLSKKEIDDIIAFMNTLTDKSYIIKKP